MNSTDGDLENLSEYSGLEKTVDKLLSPGGCPWDREQTHDSLKRNLLEECYELIEAIENKDITNMVEELGDILMQIVFHIHIGEQSGSFTSQQVFENINNKLIRRHPHVFGAGETRTAEEVKVQWEDIKQKEKKDGPSGSRLDSVPKILPALAYAQLVQDRAHLAGFDWDNYSGVLDKISEEIDELNEAQTEDEKTNEMGDVLFSLVNAGRWLGIQVEDSLRKSNAKFHRRFAYMENTSRGRGVDFKDLTMNEKESLWDEAKESVG